MMFTKDTSGVSVVKGVHCLSGQRLKIEIRNEHITDVSVAERPEAGSACIGPGLIDLQVNGINGIDFNSLLLTRGEVLKATQYLLNTGVTTYFPTVITNSTENILQILRTIRLACDTHPLVDSCIGGIHLEGPFISKTKGPRGAHNEKYIKAPDFNLIITLHKASGYRIKLITLAPEWKNAYPFIRKCRQHGILVAIGHSEASPNQIRLAVKSGATLSTHLGNGISLKLPRHPNLLWEQMAQDDLFASIIADGFHLPDSFLKVVIRAKRDKAMLVSDVTSFSGMAPGIYEAHIGEEVILKRNGKLVLKEFPDLLAGATRTLAENIQYLVKKKIVTLSDGWRMASTNPARFLGNESYGITKGQRADFVIFKADKGKEISIDKVIKDGCIVFNKQALQR